jgi:hypothetical protein
LFLDREGGKRNGKKKNMLAFGTTLNTDNLQRPLAI